MWEWNSETENRILKSTAGLMNADFGGLHLGRMGISKTRFDALRLLLLGPDWTASNFKTIAKLLPMKSDQGVGSDSFIGSDAMERHMYRAFWARAIGRIAVLTFLMNLLLSGIDDETMWERFRKAKKRGKLRAAMVDISPVIQLLGGDNDIDYYLNMGGHMFDPAKWAMSPIDSAYHKSGTLLKPALTAIKGTNYQHKRYVPFNRIMGEGLTHYDSRRHGSVKPSESFSFITTEMFGLLPIQGQQTLEFMTGETNLLVGGVRTVAGADIVRGNYKKAD